LATFQKEIEVGDDAEYYMEQQEEEARFNQASEYAVLDHNAKPVLCWADGVRFEDEIWSWEPLQKILGVFSDLHRERQIGSDCFLATSVPMEGHEEDWNNEDVSLEPDNLRKKKFVGELEFHIANSEANATHEVIVLSRHDAELLRQEVVRRKRSAKTLKEKMLAEMLEEMASAIETVSQRTAFVFARRL
jgi:hypothetical protein